MPQENEIDFQSDNIFDEFSQESQKVSEEVQKEEQKEVRDIYFYLKFLSTGLFSLNVILLLLVCIFWIYSFIQGKETKQGYSFLTPICSVFLWDVSSQYTSCYGVSSILAEQQELLSQSKTAQTNAVIELLGNMYDIKNFNLSKKVLFLLDKSQHRLEPTVILSAFDELKNKFAPVDKSEISCYDIRVYSDSMVDITCDAYSSDWDTSIIDIQDGSIQSVSGGGTSISRASSFVNFLESYPGSYFTLEQKPANFTAEEVREWPYTHKTTLQLRMKYNGWYSLAF